MNERMNEWMKSGSKRQTSAVSEAHTSVEEDTSHIQLRTLLAVFVQFRMPLKNPVGYIFVERGDEEGRNWSEDKVEERPEPVVVADLKREAVVDLEDEEDHGEDDVLVEREFNKGGQAIAWEVAVDYHQTTQEPK